MYGNSQKSNIKLNNSNLYKNEDKQITKYYFDVSYKNTSLKDINLKDTIDTETLINEKIAPGTKGEFAIILKSNQNLKYKVEFKSKNEKPYNLKFRLKEKQEEYRTLEELQNSMQGEIHINETKKINVCWEWKYESDSKNVKIQDVQDVTDSINIQTYNFTINVLGEEICD